jgi:hypothetical protein
MRQIEVETDVFALIWSLRKPGEDDENQIIKRVLHEYTAQDKDQPRLAVHAESGSHSRAQKEVKHSKFHLQGGKAEAAQIEALELGKVRWVDDIRVALSALGGKATLQKIYKAVEERRQAAGRSTPSTIEAVIRRTIEDHSSDSANFKAEDLFCKIGRGEWALR